MLLLELLAGTALGFAFGLLPSLHINLIGYAFFAFGVFSFFKGHFFFFFALCVSQTLTSIIPSLLFYTQTQDTILSPFLGQFPSTLSGLSPLISLSLLGFLLGGLFSVLFLPIFYLLFSLFSDFYILLFLVLVIVLVSLVFMERGWKARALTFSIIVFSGVLGVFTLKYNFFFRASLIPCIFGLFAFPSILCLLFSREGRGVEESKPVQELVCFKDVVSTSFLGTIFSSAVAIFPSLSPGLAMVLADFFNKHKTKENTILLYSSILSSVILIYFFLSLVFNKHRLGFLSLLSESGIIPNASFPDILALAFSFLLVLGLTTFLCNLYLPSIISIFEKLNKKFVFLLISLFTIFLVVVFCGLSGLFLLFVSTAIGFLPILYNKNRLALMSYLIVPTILFFA